MTEPASRPGCLSIFGSLVRGSVALVFGAVMVLDLTLPDPPCGLCEGKGRIECPECDDGKADCPDCEPGPRGMERYGQVRAADWMGRCRSCQGRGSLESACATCAGAHDLACGLCGGEGKRHRTR
mgnify:FL=1